MSYKYEIHGIWSELDKKFTVCGEQQENHDTTSYVAEISCQRCINVIAARFDNFRTQEEKAIIECYIVYDYQDYMIAVFDRKRDAINFVNVTNFASHVTKAFLHSPIIPKNEERIYTGN